MKGLLHHFVMIGHWVHEGNLSIQLTLEIYKGHKNKYYRSVKDTHFNILAFVAKHIV